VEEMVFLHLLGAVAEVAALEELVQIKQQQSQTASELLRQEMAE
jgi:hypothetical protein